MDTPEMVLVGGNDPLLRSNGLLIVTAPGALARILSFMYAYWVSGFCNA
jgi:hypothetical protein